MVQMDHAAGAAGFMHPRATVSPTRVLVASIVPAAVTTGVPGELAETIALLAVTLAFAVVRRRGLPEVVATVACLTELTCFLRFPREHWPRIRHQPDRADLRGTRRRVKVIGRLPGERSCLSLVWAVLDRASRGWRGVVMTLAAVRLLQELRRQLHHPSPPEEVVDQPVTPAA
jgi:hypothetical protein